MRRERLRVFVTAGVTTGAGAGGFAAGGFAAGGFAAGFGGFAEGFGRDPPMMTRERNPGNMFVLDIETK